MARVLGLNLFSGRIGDRIYYTRNGKCYSRQAPASNALTKKKWAANPQLAKIHKNCREFGKAVNCSVKLRRALTPYLNGFPASETATRINSILLKVIKSDTLNTHGNREVRSGDLRLLENFELNVDSSVNDRLKTGKDILYSPATGEFGIEIRDFIPRSNLLTLHGSSHFRIFLAALDMDFQTGAYERSVTETEYMPCRALKTYLLNIRISMSAAAKDASLLCLGIQFFSKDGKDYQRYDKGAADGLLIVRSGKPV